MELKKELATIAIETSKGVQAIQVMANGNLENTGKKLLAHYSKHYMPIIRMMNKGSLVFLGDVLKEYDKENEPNGTCSLAHQGQNKPKKEYNTIGEMVTTETKSNHMYLWVKDRWYYLRVKENLPCNSVFRELKECL